jgi:hypothetical protein
MLPLLFEGVGGPSLCVVGADDCANDDDDSVVVVEDGAGTEAIVLTTSAVETKLNCRLLLFDMVVPPHNLIHQPSLSYSELASASLSSTEWFTSHRMGATPLSLTIRLSLQWYKDALTGCGTMLYFHAIEPRVPLSTSLSCDSCRTQQSESSSPSSSVASSSSSSSSSLRSKSQPSTSSAPVVKRAQDKRIKPNR